MVAGVDVVGGFCNFVRAWLCVGGGKRAKGRREGGKALPVDRDSGEFVGRRDNGENGDGRDW